MADGVKTFGTFLRNLGAGMNPQVAAGLRQEQQLAQQQSQFDALRQEQANQAAQSRKDMLAKLIVNSVQAGNIPQAEADTALDNLGFPELKGMGASPSPRKRVNALVNDTTVPAILDEGTGFLHSPDTGQRMPNAILKEKTSRGEYSTLHDIKTVDENGNIQIVKIPYNSRTHSFMPERAMILDEGGQVVGMGAGSQFPVSPKSPEVKGAVKGAETRAKAVATREVNMSGINETLDVAKSYLEGRATGTRPTGSGIGAVSDAVGRVFGVTVKGASEAGVLEALGGSLTAKMPRMEGPQSDKDVILYRQMAGKIADRTVPVKERLAALEEVRRLWGKYEHLNKTQAKPESNVDSALDWLEKNPNHPSAPAVREKLQRQGVIK